MRIKFVNGLGVEETKKALGRVEDQDGVAWYIVDAASGSYYDRTPRVIPEDEVIEYLGH